MKRLLYKIYTFTKEHSIFILNSIVMTVFLELTIRHSFFNIFNWILKYPFYASINLSIIFCIFLFLKSSLNKIYSLILGNTFFIIIGLINFFKYSIRRSLFIPKNFSLIKELFGLWEVIFNIKILFIILICLIIYILLIKYIFYKFRNYKKERNIIFSFSYIILIILFLFFTSSSNFSESGYIYYFLSNGKVQNEITFDNKKDIGLDRLKTYIRNEKDKEKSFEDKPNIIILMNESFWDINKLDKLKFNKDLYKNFNSLKEKSQYGELIAPTFGGGTCNSEAEILTGINTNLYQGNVLLYKEKIDEPIMSLPSILRKQGYYTKAIHPYYNWYYKRNEVYRYLGFHDYLSKEFFIKPEVKGDYISDKEVINQIINSLENNENRPNFIHAITMQNHGPYSKERYNKLDINLENEIDKSSKIIFENYAQGLYDADRSLKKLIKYLKTRNDETIVLFLGDHLPPLNTDQNIFQNIYEKYGYNLKKGFNQNLTPYILWSSDGRIKSQSNNLNMYSLGNEILNYTGIKKPNYYKFINTFTNRYPLFYNNKYYQKINKDLSSIHDGVKQKIYKTYQNLILENEIIDNQKKWVIFNNKYFNNEYSNIFIDEVKKESNKIILKGDNFYPKMVLEINGKEIDFEWISKTEIQFKNKNYKKEKLNINMYLEDSKGNIIASLKK